MRGINRRPRSHFMPRKRKKEVTIEPGKGLNLDPELIRQLVPGTLDRETLPQAPFHGSMH
ncbi:hypothetical protein Bcep1808_6036 [Burkholderia vietnamiensis G4]|uniref:Uncharacterized protein n=1 Tax=Burkholderia vietnamiensis (strain G4 / LMG 22486) TaxID=269482 RepID=A4JRQ8_BURVG|nr:hypothetical protein Bcep1808_6036 [Burkholderia vietnamiensis G4]